MDRERRSGGRATVLPLAIDPSAKAPIYQQIVDQVKYSTAAGILRPNDELPSVRAVAKRHLVNPNTVARAYLELEREGIIYKRQGMGTYVADRQVSVPKKEKLAVIGQLIDKVVVQGIHFGLSADELKSELEKRLQALGRRSRDD